MAIGSVFSSTNLGSSGALPGTAPPLIIPAGTLQAGSNYASSIGFYRAVFTTNGTSDTAAVDRATVTEFTLATAGGSGPGPLLLTNAVLAPANFSFDVAGTPMQTVTVEYRANLAAGQWQTLLLTNSPGNRFRAVAPQAATNRFLFYRTRNGNQRSGVARLRCRKWQRQRGPPHPVE